MTNREGFLASIPLFSALTHDELADILQLARPVSFPPGHLVFDQGVSADGMYVLERGRVQLWARLLGDEEVALAQIGAGGVLGEFSLIDRGPRSAAAEVMEPTDGYFFSNREFDLLRADRRPATVKTMQQLRSVLCQRLRRASRELGDCAPTFYQHTQRPSSPPGPEAGSGKPAAELDLQRLRPLPFFSLFSEGELTELMAGLYVRALPRGHMIFAQGDEPSGAFVTVRGAVEIVTGAGDACRRVAILGPGRLFGLIAPLDGGTRDHSAVVRESATVLEIPSAVFARLMKAETSLAFTFSEAVHQTLIESLRAANRTLLSHSAMGRESRRKKRSISMVPP